MPDVKHKLHYRGRNWKSIETKQTRHWNSKNGAVVVVQAADPDKIEEARELQKVARDLYGLKPKKYGYKHKMKRGKNERKK